MAWWLALVLAATLPMWSFWLVNRWGGHYTEWVYYGNYRDALSACFLVSAALVAGLLRMPRRHAGLRGIGGLIFVTLWLLAAALPRPNCPEAVGLGKYGVPIPDDQAEVASCGHGDEVPRGPGHAVRRIHPGLQSLVQILTVTYIV